MAFNRSHAPPGLANYLLGIGPMPPLRPQDVAVTQMQHALDEGAFDHRWSMAPTPQGSQQPCPTPVNPRRVMEPPTLQAGGHQPCPASTQG
jgi:hypothetical protein